MFKFLMCLPGNEERLPLDFSRGFGQPAPQFGAGAPVLFCPQNRGLNPADARVGLLWEPPTGAYSEETLDLALEALADFFGIENKCCVALHRNTQDGVSRQQNELFRSLLQTDDLFFAKAYSRDSNDSMYAAFSAAFNPDRPDSDIAVDRLVQQFRPDIYGPVNEALLRFLPNYLAGDQLNGLSLSKGTKDAISRALRFRLEPSNIQAGMAILDKQVVRLTAACSPAEIATEYELLRKQMLELISDLA
jgi:hypothetical protein